MSGPHRVLVAGCDALTQRFLQDHYGADNVPGMKLVETTKVNTNITTHMQITLLT